MKIVGELINASRNEIVEAIEKQDAEKIRDIASAQARAGANFIDVNAGVFVGKESEYLNWLIETVQEAVDMPCAIDSPDPRAIEAAMPVHKGDAMINSISLEKDRLENLLPIISGTDMKIVALCMSDDGMPETVDDRLSIADKLINNLVRNNIPLDSIYVDPLAQPVATNQDYGAAFLDSVQEIMDRFEGIHTICGLSNISYGLPNRRYINRTFISMAIAKGLDTAIVNPLDDKMMADITVACTIAGKDEFCMNYLKAHRAGKLEADMN